MDFLTGLDSHTLIMTMVLALLIGGTVLAMATAGDGDGDGDGKGNQPTVTVEQHNALANQVTQINEGMAAINETLKGLQGNGGDGDGDKGGDGKGGDGKGGDGKGDESTELDTVKSQLADLTEKYTNSEKERQDLLNQQAEDQRMASIKTLAKAGGVSEDALDAFVTAKQGQFPMKDGQLVIVDAAGNPILSATKAGQPVKAKEFFEGLAKTEQFWFGAKQVTPTNVDPLQNLLGGNQGGALGDGDVQIVTVEEMRKIRATPEGLKAVKEGKIRVADQPLQQATV